MDGYNKTQIINQLSILDFERDLTFLYATRRHRRGPCLSETVTVILSVSLNPNLKTPLNLAVSWLNSPVPFTSLQPEKAYSDNF